MRAIVNGLTVLTALVWSAVVWGGYALLMMSSEFLASGTVDIGLPSEVAGVTGLVNAFIQNFGSVAAVLLWAIGLVGIILVRAVINWMIGQGRARATAAVATAPATLAPRPAPKPAARPAPRPATPPRPPVALKPTPPVAAPQPRATPAPAAEAPVAPKPAPTPQPSRWGRNAGR